MHRSQILTRPESSKATTIERNFDMALSFVIRWITKARKIGERSRYVIHLRVWFLEVQARETHRKAAGHSHAVSLKTIHMIGPL